MTGSSPRRSASECSCDLGVVDVLVLVFVGAAEFACVHRQRLVESGQADEIGAVRGRYLLCPRDQLLSDLVKRSTTRTLRQWTEVFKAVKHRWRLEQQPRCLCTRQILNRVDVVAIKIGRLQRPRLRINQESRTTAPTGTEEAGKLVAEFLEVLLHAGLCE